QRCSAGLARNLQSVTREGTPLPEPIHRFQALLASAPLSGQLLVDLFADTVDGLDIVDHLRHHCGIRRRGPQFYLAGLRSTPAKRWRAPPGPPPRTFPSNRPTVAHRRSRESCRMVSKSATPTTPVCTRYRASRDSAICRRLATKPGNS